ncbi:MAG TPA: sodium:solute symporter family protein [Kiritimatiellia bacterium]|nr:sodium:solute symporter family protein [Kiritimatiellia bacterium]HRZ12479.1 sodium:solute symporter family protein [Kiritimatiellia bacterium]HSA17763.1 sodium:solute symporter family protein [Kiritimatiellia bacterium]
MDLFSIIIVLVYLLATGYLGYQGYRQTKTAADYLVAGRSAHPVVMALSYGATFISTSAIVGFGGVAASFGMGLLWLTFLNIFVGIFIAFVVFGNPTRRMGHHLDAHTFPELMGKRYNSKFLHVFSALIIFFFMPLYATAVIIGGAEFIAPIFRVSYDTGLYLFALIVAAYVIAGGLKGVMLTDALQGAIMLVGMVILFITTYSMLGGIVPAHEALSAMKDLVPKGLQAIGHRGWTAMPEFGWSAAGAPMPDALRHNLWWVMVTTIVMGVGIGVLAQPQLIVRFMTVKSKQALNRAVIMGGIFIFFMTGVAFIVGALSNVYFAQREKIECRIVAENVLMDPGADGKAKLTLVPENAADEVKARAKPFVSYRLSGDEERQPLSYVMQTPGTVITRGVDGAPDILEPHLVAVARSVTLGTPLGGNSDTIIPTYVKAALPHWFAVVFLLTLLSAAMSTLSSQFHTIGTAVGRDVFEEVTHKRHTEKSILVTRFGICIGLLAAVIAGKVIRGNIIALATAIFMGLCAASFLPAFVGGLFWRRMNKAAAVSSMVVGFVSSTFWLAFVNGKTAAGLGLCKFIFGKDHIVPPTWSVTWTVVDPLIVALPLSILAAVVVALITKPMDKTYVDWCYGGPPPKAE